MKENALELFKLDEIDRKVFFWLLVRVKMKAVRSWIDYIEVEYQRKRIAINSNYLFNEGVSLLENYSKNMFTHSFHSATIQFLKSTDSVNLSEKKEAY
ncbi:MAG TPA: hypothetical protein VL443_17605 [Cyclobacteriaceae bacterium]|jgi:hypothetical protein|nr:hypothetical protein [Cyclobacteriaceae bacterium]